MAKVYATVPGAEVQIPPFGVATNDDPCRVPPEVGAELGRVEGFRVEPDEPASTKRKSATPREAADKE